MQYIQTDYETDLTLAVFHTADELEAAVRGLHQAGVRLDSVSRFQLPPGRYIRSDASGAEEVQGALRGVEIGLPAGAAVGFGVAVSMLGGSPEVTASMAGAGALAGGVLGALEGAVLRTHFDDDVTSTYRVSDDAHDMVLAIRTGGMPSATPRARQILTAGAAAILDQGSFPLLNLT